MIIALFFFRFSVADISIDINEKIVLNTIGLDHPYVCANFDWWPDVKCDYGNCSWVGNGINNLDLDNVVLNQAARALSQGKSKFGLLRIGGSLQDHISYNFTQYPANRHCDPYPMAKNDSRRTGFDNGCLSFTRRSELQKFATETGYKIIFGVNGLYGRKQVGYTNWTGQWDPSQAQRLFEEFRKTDFISSIFAVELGNEIYGKTGIAAKLAADVAATDFITMYQVLQNFQPDQRPKLLGTDNALDIAWMREFMKELASQSQNKAKLDGFTWHAYPLGAGKDEKVDSEIMNPDFGSKIDKTGQAIQKEEWTKDLPAGVWMGETGGAYNSGRNTVTNRFMSAFWYMDWLGILANRGHKAFCRQTLIGGNYGLLQNINGIISPNPDFWGASLFNSLMIGDVIDTTNTYGSGLHQYATHLNGTVTILLLNYENKKHNITTKNASLQKYSQRRIFHVTSNDLQSSKVYINSKLASFPSNGTDTPNVLEYGRDEPNTWPIQMAPYSYLFGVISPDTNEVGTI